MDGTYACANYMVRVRTCFGVPKTRKLTQEMCEQRKVKVPRNLDFSALFGALEGIRIPDLPLRRRTLYPAELQAHTLSVRANSFLPRVIYYIKTHDLSIEISLYFKGFKKYIDG